MIHGDACFAYFNKIWGIPDLHPAVARSITGAGASPGNSVTRGNSTSFSKLERPLYGLGHQHGTAPMKRILLAAVALATLTLSAAARSPDRVPPPPEVGGIYGDLRDNKMPRRFFGNWCNIGSNPDGAYIYKRDERCTGAGMIIHAKGFRGSGTDPTRCKVLFATANRNGWYFTRFNCKGEQITFYMLLDEDDGQLIVEQH
jgi:hypothetical protein